MKKYLLKFILVLVVCSYTFIPGKLFAQDLLIENKTAVKFNKNQEIKVIEIISEWAPQVAATRAARKGASNYNLKPYNIKIDKAIKITNIYGTRYAVQGHFDGEYSLDESIIDNKKVAKMHGKQTYWFSCYLDENEFGDLTMTSAFESGPDFDFTNKPIE